MIYKDIKFLTKLFLIISKNHLRKILSLVLNSYVAPTRINEINNFFHNSFVEKKQIHFKRRIYFNYKEYVLESTDKFTFEKNVYLIVDLRIFGKEGRLCSGESSFTPQNFGFHISWYTGPFGIMYSNYNIHFNLNYPIFFRKVSLRIDKALILFDTAPNNYYHFLFELLVKLSGLKDVSLPTKNVVIHKPVFEFQFEWLKILSKDFNFIYYENKDIII